MIGMIVPANLKFCPYVSYYTDLYKKNNIPYEIISWNKANISEDVDYSMNFSVKDENFIMRLIGYVAFSRFIKRICKKNRYDGLLIFTIAPAIVISSLLKKEYQNRYYLDVRDDTFLRKLMKKTTTQVINGACNISSSSKEFDSWISRETTLSHNADIHQIKPAVQSSENSVKTSCNTHPTRIMCAGMMIEEDINIELLDKLKNNEEFSFLYYGSENDGKRKIIDFCQKNNIQNVYFFGTYKKEDIYSIYQNNADWCNIIRADTVVNRNALPNKLYDSIIAGTPVIVLAHNKAVCDYVKKYNLGIVFDDLDDLSKNFTEKSRSFDFSLFSKGRTDFLQQVLNDSEKFTERIMSWTYSVIKS